MTGEQWQAELDRMLIRSKAAHDFVSGTLSPADFEEVLYKTGRDPYELAAYWENGVSVT